MKKLLFFVLLLITLPGFSQGDESIATITQLNTFLSTDEGAFNPESDFEFFLNKLEKKKATIKKEKDFVRYIFSKTHQEYLKRYVEYASFSRVFEDGAYNCLSGTILYSTILNHFHIQHEVIETNYHIFITAQTAQGKVLLEATDPVSGFVDSHESIQQRIESYKQNTLTASNAKMTYYQFNFELFNSVSIDELRGLLYYNKAVDSFNRQKLQESIYFLIDARKLYSSSRIDEFSQVLLLTLQQSAFDQETKTEYIKLILAVQQDPSQTVASLSAF